MVACSILAAVVCADDVKNGPKTEKITIHDARDKRQLSNFHENPPQIQRRITNYAPPPGYEAVPFNQPSFHHHHHQDYSHAASASAPYPNSYGPAYSVQPPSGFGGYPHHHHAQHQQPQYIEAPEPIIEIIIKESNETLPAPEPIKAPKKKKEQVQVFYVKYNKDAKKGLIIDDPIPGKQFLRDKNDGFYFSIFFFFFFDDYLFLFVCFVLTVFSI